MKKKFKLFCFGFGQVAKQFVENLIKKKYNFDLVTTNTTETQTRKLNNKKYKSYYFLNGKFDKGLLADLDSSNKILISISPQNGTDIVLKEFGYKFKKNKFDWVTYLSATSVYGDKEGAWVDEKTKTTPTSSRGIERLKVENKWLKYYKDFKLPLQIFRLAGIYSSKNNIINRLKLGNAKIVEKENHYFSRIHVEDIAEILSLSFKKNKAGEIFNISDNYPCSNEEITEYAANLIKINLPKKIKVKDIKNRMLKDFYKDSKKVSNKKMKIFFDYDLKYPTFKEGLKSVGNNNV